MATIAQICNNPLNIRASKTRWQGLIGEYKGFAQFETTYFGLRAAMLNLRHYFKLGLRTPRTIINRWAPPVENDTSKYVDYVTAALGFVSSHEQIQTYNEFVDLVCAMAKMESGYSDTNYINFVFDDLLMKGEFKGINLKF